MGLPITSVFSSEIEPFPCEVLRVRHPESINLGDMTKLHDTEIPSVDIVFAGTPCQDFSVAGKRAGFAGDRGSLTFVFLELVRKNRWPLISFENVPGIIQTECAEGFKNFLDDLEGMGYVLDVDILDAQFHGVPQRRRRVFVCGEHIDHLLSKKTTESALTIYQCLMENLLLVLEELSDQSHIVSGDLTFDATRPVHSLKRRMKLFRMHEAGAASKLANYLDEIQQLSECGRGDSESVRGKSSAAGSKNSGGTKYQESVPAADRRDGFLNTDTSWKSILEECLLSMSECITSTATRETTQSRIYSCAILTLFIARRIIRLPNSSPSFWSAASSGLTAVKGFTDYARHTSSSIFADMEWVQPWFDFIREAEQTIVTLGSIRVENFGKVFPISDSLSGHPAPSREAGERVAASLTRGADSSGKGGYAGRRREDDSNIVGCLSNGAHNGGGLMGRTFIPDASSLPQTAWALQERDSKGTDGDTKDGHLIGGFFETAHSLRADGFDASEDGTGRGTPIVPIGYTITGTNKTKRTAFETDTAGSIRTKPPGSIENSSTTVVAFQTRFARNGRGAPESVCPTLQGATAGATAGATSDMRPCVALPMAVRRLTPVECSRLQGFPGDYLDIQFRGKPAADGPKYRALGNSMAVPVVRWILERILKVERAA
jgi:DNA-cytosine methyltransferase